MIFIKIYYRDMQSKIFLRKKNYYKPFIQQQDLRDSPLYNNTLWQSRAGAEQCHKTERIETFLLPQHPHNSFIHSIKHISHPFELILHDETQHQPKLPIQSKRTTQHLYTLKYK